MAVLQTLKWVAWNVVQCIGMFLLMIYIASCILFGFPAIPILIAFAVMSIVEKYREFKTAADAGAAQAGGN